MSEDILRFRVGHQWYGIPVAEVIEVLHLVALSEMPGAPADVLGLLTLRDEVLPVIDLRLTFGTPERALSLNTPMVAVHHAERDLVLVIDDVDGVVSAMRTGAQDISMSQFVRAVAHTEGSTATLLLLDLDAIGARLAPV
jgi:purine-binding chemotaxis protein CheW